MSDKLNAAKSLLEGGSFTCVLCDGNSTVTFKERGVSPLLRLLDQGKDRSRYSAADKVVGNGAAYLYVLLKIKEVYASVISEAAYKTLTDNNIEVYFDNKVSYIKNRAGNGMCPIEQAVADAQSADDALEKIKTKLKELKS